MEQKYEIPVWKKLNLTFEEAAEYSQIGQNRLRELAKQPGCPWILKVGNKTLIKRTIFEQDIAFRKIV